MTPRLCASESWQMHMNPCELDQTDLGSPERLRLRLRKPWRRVASTFLVCVIDACSSASGDGSAPPLVVAASPLPLTPTFSPDIHDYAVRCDATTDHLTLDLSPEPGETVSVAGSDMAAISSKSTVTVSLVEDQAIALQVASSRRGSIEDYSIR